MRWFRVPSAPRRFTQLAGIITAFSAMSCQVVGDDHGSMSSAGGASSGGQGPDLQKPASCQHSLGRRVRRLSAREYLNVLTDLLGEAAAVTARPLLPFEPRLAG